MNMSVALLLWMAKTISFPRHPLVVFCWASPLLPVQFIVDIEELWEEGMILGTFLLLEHRACLLAYLLVYIPIRSLKKLFAFVNLLLPSSTHSSLSILVKQFCSSSLVSCLPLIIRPALHLAHCKSICSAIRPDIPLYIRKLADQQQLRS